MAGEKVAVVTAGGSGMGAAHASASRPMDFKIAILSSSGKGEALASQLGGVGVTGSSFSRSTISKRLVDTVFDRWGCVLVEQRGSRSASANPEITDAD